MTTQTVAPAVGTAAPVAPTPPARMAAGLAVVVALVGALLGPAGQLDGLLGSNAITVSAGRVEAQTAAGWVTLPIGARVAPGTTLRTRQGQATLGVRDGTIDLAEGSRVTAGDRMRVAAGAVVVHGSRTVVGDGAMQAQGTDTWRYDAAGRISAYTGSAVLTDAADREVLVRALQEVRVRDGVLAAEPRPYTYIDTDTFDRRYLATALEVDDHLAALRRGLQGQYGTAPQRAAFYTDFEGMDGARVAALGDVGFERVGDRMGPPADVLVASVVTEALVVDAGLASDTAAGRVRDLRLAGATWGLVVQAHDLDASHVRAAADRALARRQLAEQQGTAVPVSEVPAPGATAPPDAVVGAPTDGDPGTPPRPDEQERVPGDDAVPPTSDDPDDGSGPVGDVVDESGADELLDGDAGDLVDEVVDTADDVVEDVADGSGQLVDALDPTSPTDGPTSSGGVGGAVDAVETDAGSLRGD